MDEHDSTSKPNQRKADADGAGGHGRRAIVAGYGPVGRTVAEQLERDGVDVTIIETNESTIQRQAALQKHVVHGDVCDAAVLRAAGIDRAAALVLAIPDEKQAVEACRVARELNPRIYIAARTNFVSQGMLATEAGADHVVIEEVVTANAMEHAVMDWMSGKA